MRNRPSEQSRDGRCPRQNCQPTESRYITRQLSEERKSNDSRTTRRAENKMDAYFEYVPSMQSNQTRFLSNEGRNYRKPSLPYYVVPVLYVPQKVLSSEEIRPATAPLENKRTVSFLVKNSKPPSERNTELIDVDQIPCIPCETMKKLNSKKDNCECNEIFVSNVDLDQPYSGYINASYTQSSTSEIADLDCQDFSQRKLHNPKSYYRRSNKEYNPQNYHHLIEQQTNSHNKTELNEGINADVRLRWNPESNCYEKIDNASIVCQTSTCNEENTQRVPMKSRRDFAGLDYGNISKPLGQYATTEAFQRRNINTPKTKPRAEFEHDREYYQPQIDSCNYKACRENIVDQEPYSIYFSSDDHDEFGDDIEEQLKSRSSRYSQVSTLSCEKHHKVLGHVVSLVGTSLIGTSVSNQSNPKKKHPDVFTTEVLYSPLDEASILTVARKKRKPKESQTTFDDVVIYSTYVATDETIRDSKSTQTVDATTVNATTGTQTDRLARSFVTCPPPCMEQVRVDAAINVKPRNREVSPSPTRIKRNNSPTKQSIGDVKKAPAVKTMEVTQRPSINQSMQNYPPKKYKRKKVRATWSPA